METISISSKTDTGNDNSEIVSSKKKKIEGFLLSALCESQSINDEFLSYLINMTILEIHNREPQISNILLIDESD